MRQIFRLGKATTAAALCLFIGDIATARAQVVIENSGNVSIGVGPPHAAAADFKVTGSAAIQRNLAVVGSITAGSAAAPSGLVVNGPSTLNGTVTVGSAASLQSLSIFGSTDISGALQALGGVTIGLPAATKNLTVNGDASVTGTFRPNNMQVGGTFSVKGNFDADGNTELGTTGHSNTLKVHAATKIDDGLVVAGPSTLQNVTIGQADAAKNLVVLGSVNTTSLLVSGNSTFSQKTVFAGETDVGQSGKPSEFFVYGPATVTGELDSGNATVKRLHATNGVTGDGTASFDSLSIKQQASVGTDLTVTKSITAESINGFGTIPIGAIIDYYPPTSSTALPANFVVCDGSQITVQGSPFSGRNSPDLRDKFVRGAQNESSVGTSGGADSDSVSVQVVMPAQTGGITAAAPADIVGGTDAVLGLIQARNPSTTWRFSLVDQEKNNKPWWNDGNHVHSIPQPKPVTIVVKTVPKYVTLLKIMRVK